MSKNHKNRKCFNCGDLGIGKMYYVRPNAERKIRFKVDFGCLLLLDSKGIIDMSKTKIAE